MNLLSKCLSLQDFSIFHLLCTHPGVHSSPVARCFSIKRQN
uniref:Uncharacterized protein n=1 Tax=Anguilla anguilla TaxID=7936 RepID=A0A0E9UFB3_ANGAN